MNAVTKAARREINVALQRASDAATLGGLSDRELLELIRQSPIPHQLLERALEAKRQRREQLVAMRDRELETSETDGTQLRERFESLDKAILAEEAKLETLKLEREQVRTKWQSRTMKRDHTVSAIDAQLVLLAPDAIDAFIARLTQAFELQRGGAISEIELAKNWTTGDSEAAAMARRNRARYLERNLRFEGYGAAIAKAEELKLTALDGEELQAALQGLEDNMVELAKEARLARGQEIL